MAEAAAQFEKGLDQLKLLPDNPERKRQQLELHSALGAVLIAVKVMPHRKREVASMPEHKSCGILVLPQSSFTFRLCGHSVT